MVAASVFPSPLHFGDLPVGHCERAEDLHIERALAEYSFGDGSGQCEGFDQRNPRIRGATKFVIAEVVEFDPAPVDFAQLQLVLLPPGRSGDLWTDQVQVLR
jgi:hypothetical protein